MIRFLVYLEFIQKSLSFQLVKYCLPPFEGGLPFIRVARGKKSASIKCAELKPNFL